MIVLAPPPRRPALLALVLAAHAALLLGWRLADRQAAAPMRDAAPTLVLLRLPPPTVATPSARPPGPAARRALQAPIAATLPAMAATAASAAADTPADAAAPPDPPASTPLKLDLRRGSATTPRHGNPALNDARANSPPRTVESRIAGVIGDGRWTEELLPDGRRRWRRGAECTVVQPARAEALFPFAATKPQALVGDC